MIVVLGHGRETQAWLARRGTDGAGAAQADGTGEAQADGTGAAQADGTGEAVLVLDEHAAATSDVTTTGGGLELRRVDLDDVASVRSAIGGRRVTEVVRSPGISPYRPGPAWLVSLAPCATPTGLWLADAAPDDLVIVTGTKGKSTVTSMTAHLLRAAGREVVLAGNIGVALTTVDADAPRDDLVVELSSYQLADLELPVPAVAAGLTTLFVDHAPWHGGIARYHADKLRILGLARWRVVGPQVVEIGMAAGRYDAVAGHPTPEVTRALAQAGMHGRHEGEAAMLALALVARRIGTDARDLVGALATFTPLPHRLRPVVRAQGRTYVDDSIATVPEAALAALATWRPRGPVTLVLGGEDRGQDLTALRAALDDADVRAVLLGPLGARLADELAASGTASASGASGTASVAAASDSARSALVTDLAAAIAWAHANTPDGGAVLLSPAAPSFGMFRDFVERGERFAALALELPGAQRVDGTA